MNLISRFYVFAGVVSAVACASANQLTNGDFEAGNFGFSSDYIFANSNSTEGQYTVSSTPSSFNGAFFNIPDHTSGSGKYLVVNGATSGSPKLWRQTVTVTAATSYIFDGFYSTAVAGGPANLQLLINGQAVGSAFTLPNSVGTWLNANQVWNSGTSTSATLELVNTNLSFFPNDFYVDDLSFEAVPEPATMTVLGFGIAAILRKNRKA